MENRKPEQSKYNQEKAIDPIGVEFLLGVFSTLITTVAALHQFGFLSRKRKDLHNEFESIHREILRLQNTLDDFILLVQRYISQSDNKELASNKLTISETMMLLKDREYYRWMDLQDAIKHLDHRIYSLVSKIRVIAMKYRNEHPSEAFEVELLRAFDEQILRMGEVSFGDFVIGIRDLAEKLSGRLAELVYYEKR